MSLANKENTAASLSTSLAGLATSPLRRPRYAGAPTPLSDHAFMNIKPNLEFPMWMYEQIQQPVTWWESSEPGAYETRSDESAPALSSNESMRVPSVKFTEDFSSTEYGFVGDEANVFQCASTTLLDDTRASPSTIFKPRGARTAGTAAERVFAIVDDATDTGVVKDCSLEESSNGLVESLVNNVAEANERHDAPHMKNRFKGKVPKKEPRKRASAATKAVKKKSKTKNQLIPNKARAIQKIDLETGQVIQTYKSFRKASATNNVSRRQIVACLTGSKPQAGGFLWRTVEPSQKTTAEPPKTSRAKTGKTIAEPTATKRSKRGAKRGGKQPAC